MAQINFRLKKGTKKVNIQSSWISLSMTIESKNQQEKKTLEKHWNEKQSRVKANLKSEVTNDYEVTNKKLDEFEAKAKEIITHGLYNDIELTPSYFNRQ